MNDYIPSPDLTRRVENCEKEIETLKSRQTEYAIENAKLNTKLDNVLVTLGELKNSLEDIRARPQTWLDKIIAAIIGTVITAAIAYFLK